MDTAKTLSIIYRGFAPCRRLRRVCRATVLQPGPVALFLPEAGYTAARLLAAAFLFVEILQFFPVDEANAAFFVAADEVYLLQKIKGFFYDIAAAAKDAGNVFTGQGHLFRQAGVAVAVDRSGNVLEQKPDDKARIAVPLSQHSHHFRISK